MSNGLQVRSYGIGGRWNTWRKPAPGGPTRPPGTDHHAGTGGRDPARIGGVRQRAGDPLDQRGNRFAVERATDLRAVLATGSERSEQPRGNSAGGHAREETAAPRL